MKRKRRRILIIGVIAAAIVGAIIFLPIPFIEMHDTYCKLCIDPNLNNCRCPQKGYFIWIPPLYTSILNRVNLPLKTEPVEIDGERLNLKKKD